MSSLWPGSKNTRAELRSPVAFYAITHHSPFLDLYIIGFSEHALLAASPTLLPHVHLRSILCCSPAPGLLHVLPFQIEG